MRVTIITVSYNSVEGLRKTMNSVFSQIFQNYEYVIIDGGSSDGSRELIEQYADKIAYWCSEKDKGIYDGMNKGIAKAKGDYLLFMNAGDVFASNNVLYDVFFGNDYKADLIVGRQHYIRNGKKSICRRTYAEEVNEQFLISNTLPHQATFIKRELINKVGGYCLDYRIVADWVFWYEAVVNHKAKVYCIDTFVADMEQEGASGNINECRAEMARYLMGQKSTISIEDWNKIIQDNSDAYQFRRSLKGKLSALLVKIALRLNKN